MKVSLGVLRHPKFLKFRSLIGKDALEYLVRLWGHCEEDQRGGCWLDADEGYVESVVDWRGRKGVMFKALLECKWIELPVEGPGIVVHDWDEMNWRAVTNWKVGKGGGRPPRNPRVNPGVTARANPDAVERQPHDDDLRNPRAASGQTPLNEGMNEGMKGGVQPPPQGFGSESGSELVDPLPPEAVVPSEEEVLAFGREWPGAPAWGAEPGMPDAWVLGWYAAQLARRGGWPANWRRVLVARYRADWVAGRVRPVDGVGQVAAGSGGARPMSDVARRIDLVREAEGLALEIDEHIAVTAANPTESERADLRKKRARLEQVNSLLRGVREVAV